MHPCNRNQRQTRATVNLHPPAAPNAPVGLGCFTIRPINIKRRFTLFRRGKIFYCQDTKTGQQLSLKPRDEAAAHALLHAKNEAHRRPVFNLQMARTYLDEDGEAGISVNT